MAAPVLAYPYASEITVFFVYDLQVSGLMNP